MLTNIPPRLEVFSQTSLREVKTGRPLDRFGEGFTAGLQEFVDGFQLQRRYDGGASACREAGGRPFRAPRDGVDWIRFTYVHPGHYAAFRKDAGCMFSEGRSARNDYRLDASEQTDVDELWNALLAFSSEYASPSQIIDLPPVLQPELPSVEYAVILIDNGKDASVAQLIGGKGLISSSLTAEL
jgi:hypothetical protein